MDKQTSESVRDFFVQYPLYAIVDEWLRPVAWTAVVTACGWFVTWWRQWRWQREFRGAAIAFIGLTIILVLLTSRPAGYPRDFDTGGIVSAHPAIVITILLTFALVSSVPAWVIAYRSQAPVEPKYPSRTVNIPTQCGVRDFAEFLTIDGPWFAHHPKANFKSKLVLDLTNSGNQSIHFLENISWTSEQGDVGLQSDVRFGYWVYPKGKTVWVDSIVDPLIQPNERLHIWVGLDQARPGSDLNNRKRAKRLGILRIPVEIDGEKGLVEYRL